MSTAGVPPELPQLASGPLVISQIAIAGLSVVMSASKVPLKVGWATIGERKKKPGVPLSWTPSEIANSGPGRGAVGRSPDEHASTIRRAGTSQATREVSDTAILHPRNVRMTGLETAWKVGVILQAAIDPTEGKGTDS